MTGCKTLSLVQSRRNLLKYLVRVEMASDWCTRIYRSIFLQNRDMACKPCCAGQVAGYPTGKFHSDQATHEEHGSGYNGYTATRHDDQFFLGKDILLAPIINQG